MPDRRPVLSSLRGYLPRPLEDEALAVLTYQIARRAHPDGLCLDGSATRFSIVQVGTYIGARSTILFIGSCGRSCLGSRGRRRSSSSPPRSKSGGSARSIQDRGGFDPKSSQSTSSGATAASMALTNPVAHRYSRWLAQLSSLQPRGRRRYGTAREGLTDAAGDGRSPCVVA